MPNSNWINQLAKSKRNLTAAEKRAKKERNAKYQIVFMNGKQVRIRRPETNDGMREWNNCPNCSLGCHHAVRGTIETIVLQSGVPPIWHFEFC